MAAWATGRAQVRAVARDERVGLVISSAGSDLPGRRMVRVRARAALLDPIGYPQSHDSRRVAGDGRGGAR